MKSNKLKKDNAYISAAPLLQMLFFLSLEYYFVTNSTLCRVSVTLHRVGNRLIAGNLLMTIGTLDIMAVVVVFIIQHLFLLREELLLAAKHFLFCSLSADS